MNILIYGTGAVGLGIASCLLQSAEPVTLIGREDTVAPLNSHGLIRTGIFGNISCKPEIINASISLKTISPVCYDYILVCTKSFDSLNTARYISSYPSLVNENTKIILFQNGWGNAEVFTEFFPEQQIFNARVITGFCRPEKNHVDITVHADAIHIGSLFSRNLSGLEYLCSLITTGGIPCEISYEIEKDLWAKMFYNCSLNPVGALFGVTYGVLGEWEQTRAIMNDIIMEAFHVMEQSGYTTHWATGQEYLNIFYSKLIPATASHTSSTLQDIRAKKRTEIDSLNGAIIALAKKRNIPVHCNRMIYNMIKFLEAKTCIPDQ